MHPNSEILSCIIQKVRVSPFLFVLLFLITGLAILLYLPGINELARRWIAQPEYSHGFLIPLVTIYIIWEQRRYLEFDWGLPNYLGLALVICAAVLAIVGEISALFLLVHLSLVLFLLGISFLYFGLSAKNITLAIAFLVFSIPLPYFIEATLTSKLQLFSSSVGVSLIRLLDIPVYLDGNIVDLGSFKLHVVEACSGLRYLFPLVSIGVVITYFYRASLWKKALIVFSCVPIAIAMNSFRIAATAILVKYYGNQTADGFVHAFEGWIVFLICLVFLIIEIYVLERFTSRRPVAQCFSNEQVDSPYSPEKSLPSRTCYAGLVLVVLVLVTTNVLLMMINHRSDNVSLQRSLATFPMTIEGWRGHRSVLDTQILEELGADDYLLANYSSQLGDVNFYLAYYENQRKGVSPHSPKVCIPGGGWEINKIETLTLGDVEVNEVEIQKGLRKQLVYYWFVERGSTVANEYEKKWLLLRDAIFENRTDGALVRLVTAMDANQDEAGNNAAEERIRSFYSAVQPMLQQYLPAAPRE